MVVSLGPVDVDCSDWIRSLVHLGLNSLFGQYVTCLPFNQFGRLGRPRTVRHPAIMHACKRLLPNLKQGKQIMG